MLHPGCVSQLTALWAHTSTANASVTPPLSVLPPSLLQLQPGATGAAVRRRYRELAVTLHPDKCRSEGASEAFQRLVRAYQSLLQFAR